MPKGFPIGFEMSEKNGNKQTNKHFRIYMNRDYEGSMATIFINDFEIAQYIKIYAAENKTRGRETCRKYKNVNCCIKESVIYVR